MLLQIVHGHVGGDAVCTVRVAVLLTMLFEVAVILEDHADCPLAKPVPLIIAAVGFEEFHVT